jgi:sorbitol-specific phosphotransferase system component IIA
MLNFFKKQVDESAIITAPGKRLNDAIFELDHLKIVIKNLQDQLDNFEIRLAENKKVYQKLLKERMEALKEEEEGSEEEGEIKEKFL